MDYLGLTKILVKPKILTKRVKKLDPLKCPKFRHGAKENGCIISRVASLRLDY